MNKILILLLSIAAIAGSVYFYKSGYFSKSEIHQIELEVIELFNDWKQQNEIKYESPLEEIKRLSIFHSNYHKVNAHNADKQNKYKVIIFLFK